jgi:large subunit ribosomal protein L32
MAVPKRKVTPGKRGQRRSHYFIKKINISFDKVTGEPKLPHHVSMVDGQYNGRQVFTPKSKIPSVVQGEGQSDE